MYVYEVILCVGVCAEGVADQGADFLVLGAVECLDLSVGW